MIASTSPELGGKEAVKTLFPDAQKRLISNIVASMKSVPKYIQEKQIGHFLKADPAYWRGGPKG